VIQSVLHNICKIENCRTVLTLAVEVVVVVAIVVKGKGKGKAIPLQAWTGPEAFRRLGLPDFKTIGI
jgi:hypothetical protein